MLFKLSMLASYNFIYARKIGAISDLYVDEERILFGKEKNCIYTKHPL